MNEDIPKEILERVNEFTNGGFIILYTDRDGNPSYTPYIKSATVLAGLLGYAKNLGIAWETSQLHKIINFFQSE